MTLTYLSLNAHGAVKIEAVNRPALAILLKLQIEGDNFHRM